MKTSRIVARHGFTLIELLVVIAIIATLIGLLLPAVQKVREAASRTKCQNNMKQIGLAFHLFHDTRLFFPQGGNAVATPTLNDYGWTYQILPYIEQGNVYDRGTVSVSDSLLINSAIAVYYCPTRRAVDSGRSRTDYAGCAGTNDGTSTGNALVTTNKQNGAVAVNGKEKVRVADIKDGTSNTLLMGEKQLNQQKIGETDDDNVSTTYPASSCISSRWDTYTLVRASTPNASPQADKNDTTTTKSAIFGSSHTQAMNAALCDGSVRVISFSTSNDAFTRVCTRAGKDIFNPEDL